MKITRIGTILGCLMLLEACGTSSPSQVTKSQVKDDVSTGWRAINVPLQPLSHQHMSSADITQGYHHSRYSNPNVYWARLQKSNAKYVVTEVSNSSLSRANLSEEIIVFDAERKVLHPAFDEIGNPPKMKTSALCTKKQIEDLRPYSSCNSAFSGTTGASVAARLLFGLGTVGKTELMRDGRVDLEYLPDTLTAAIDGATIESLLPTAKEKRQAVVLLQDSAAAEKRRIKQAEREAQQENARRVAENKKAEAANKIRALTALPKGYKDVCEYNFAELRAVGTLDPDASELACINSGAVPGLNGLKAASFIVTNVTERTPGDRSSSRFNVEKIR